jgi:hypothetical protein
VIVRILRLALCSGRHRLAGVMLHKAERVQTEASLDAFDSANACSGVRWAHGDGEVGEQAFINEDTGISGAFATSRIHAGTRPL